MTQEYLLEIKCRRCGSIHTIDGSSMIPTDFGKSYSGFLYVINEVSTKGVVDDCEKCESKAVHDLVYYSEEVKENEDALKNKKRPLVAVISKDARDFSEWCYKKAENDKYRYAMITEESIINGGRFDSMEFTPKAFSMPNFESIADKVNLCIR